MSSKEDRQKMLKGIEEKHGRLDVLVVNPAASVHMGAQLDITEKAFDKMFELNVKSTFFTVAEARPLLLKGKNPNVLITTSVAGFDVPQLIGIYGVTKSAVNGII